MTVFKKLMNVRTKLADAGVKKTGWNPHAEFWYYELDDFLPKAMKIFNDEGLCPIVSFTRELATLTIHSIEDGSKVEITSPFGETQIPGCNEIQNIGSSETYSRRYLYLAALEIVENDVSDATNKPTGTTATSKADERTPGATATGTTQMQDQSQPQDTEEDILKWLDTVEKVTDLERLKTAENNLEDFFKTEAAKKRVRNAIEERRKALGETA